MKIGVVGLGKLGLPSALAMERAGYEVVGYETSRAVHMSIADRRWPYVEPGVREALSASKMQLVPSMDALVLESDVIFVAVQTPHEPRFEGITRMPAVDRADFDYTWLKDAMRAIVAACNYRNRDPVIAIISTVLPGTIEREILPITDGLAVVYNPFFIAMGTVLADIAAPEFVLLGGVDTAALDTVAAVHAKLNQAPCVRLTYSEAECVKVLYNTAISGKISFANVVGEVCDAVGARADAVIDALGQATGRLLSARYLRPGIGDGGACHPRDNIAMSWFAREHKISCDPFAGVMQARERHMEKLAAMSLTYGLPVVVLGKSYKAGIGITTGSAAVLLASIIAETKSDVRAFDPYIDSAFDWPVATYVVATNHAEFADAPIPTGSVVIDPWRYIPEREGVTLVRIGGGA